MGGLNTSIVKRMGPSKTPIKDYIDHIIHAETGEGSRFVDRNHFEEARMVCAQVYQIPPDILVNPDNHFLTIRHSQVLGALMGLTNDEFMKFRRMIEDKGKKPRADEESLKYRNRFDSPTKLQIEVNTLVEMSRAKKKAVETPPPPAQPAAKDPIEKADATPDTSKEVPAGDAKIAQVETAASTEEVVTPAQPAVTKPILKARHVPVTSTPYVSPTESIPASVPAEEPKAIPKSPTEPQDSLDANRPFESEMQQACEQKNTKDFIACAIDQHTGEGKRFKDKAMFMAILKNTAEYFDQNFKPISLLGEKPLDNNQMKIVAAVLGLRFNDFLVFAKLASKEMEASLKGDQSRQSGQLTSRSTVPSTVSYSDALDHVEGWEKPANAKTGAPAEHIDGALELYLKGGESALRTFIPTPPPSPAPKKKKAPVTLTISAPKKIAEAAAPPAAHVIDYTMLDQGPIEKISDASRTGTETDITVERAGTLPICGLVTGNAPKEAEAKPARPKPTPEEKEKNRAERAAKAQERRAELEARRAERKRRREEAPILAERERQQSLRGGFEQTKRDLRAQALAAAAVVQERTELAARAAAAAASRVPTGETAETSPERHHNARRSPEKKAPAPTMGKEEFAARFDALLEIAFVEEPPSGKGRTWMLTQFVANLQNHKGMNRKELCSDIARQAGLDIGHQLWIKFNNMTDNRVLAESYDPATKHDIGTKTNKGLDDPEMLSAIAHYAFPDDEQRRAQCVDFLKTERFKVPEWLNSKRRSEVMTNLRRERGSDWGTVAGRRKNKPVTDDILPPMG